MITVTVNKTHGAQTVRASISAPSIEEAVRIAGDGARLEFPIDGDLFFAPQEGYPVAKEGTDDASTGRRQPTRRASQPLWGLLGEVRRDALPARTFGARRRVAGWAAWATSS